jgi:hypothetical protein
MHFIPFIPVAAVVDRGKLIRVGGNISIHGWRRPDTDSLFNFHPFAFTTAHQQFRIEHSTKQFQRYRGESSAVAVFPEISC